MRGAIFLQGLFPLYAVLFSLYAVAFSLYAVLFSLGTLSSGNADGDADPETGGKIGERTPLCHN